MCVPPSLPPYLEPLGGDVANGGLNVIRDPLNEVGRVLVDDVEHLLVHFLGGHAPAEHAGAGQVPREGGGREGGREGEVEGW